MTRLLLLVIAWSSLSLVACSSSSSGGTSDGGSDGGSDGPIAHAPKNHRASPTTCTPSKPSSTCPVGPPAGGNCKSDADCTAGTNGHCVQDGGGILACDCAYDSCVTDADCGGTSGGVCACQGSPFEFASNSCVASSCRVDADCGASGYCSPSPGTGCTSDLVGYFCHKSSDECIDDADCKAPGLCAYDATKGHWACFPLVACA